MRHHKKDKIALTLSYSLISSKDTSLAFPDPIVTGNFDQHFCIL